MPAYYNENDAYCAQWLRNLIAAGLIAPGDVDERSIVDVRPADLDGYTQCHFFAGVGLWSYSARISGVGDDEPLWSGSCPCQPFSGAGRHDGFEDERDLWPAWLPLIEKRRPSRIFGEQVASPAGRGWLSRLRTDLERLGYQVGAADLCAAGIGAPQIRQRLWWVADADDKGWQGRERQGQQDQAGTEREASRREPLRPARRPWPPGPNQIGTIPLCADGRPGRVGRLRAYGNAIVPQVAAEFIQAADEAMRVKP